MPLLKQHGTVRICGDYRITVNQALHRDQYPIPRIEDLFSSLAGGKAFSKLGLSHAYQQLLLDDETKSMQQSTPTEACSSIFGHGDFPTGE